MASLSSVRMHALTFLRPLQAGRLGPFGYGRMDSGVTEVEVEAGAGAGTGAGTGAGAGTGTGAGPGTGAGAGSGVGGCGS